MRLHLLRAGAAGLVSVAFASCGGGGAGTSTENTQQGKGAAASTFQMLNWDADLVRRLPGRRPAPKGMEVVEATRSTAPGTCPSRCFYLVRDRPALTGADLVSARQSIDPVTGEPSVLLALTREGQDRFQQLTQAVAQRAAKQNSAGGRPGASTGQFAIILAGRVLSLPFVDATQNPDGIDAKSGVQMSGGFSAVEARNLARALNSP